MRSGLSIQDGVYIEEPLRTRVDRPIIADGGIFDRKNMWRKQDRHSPPPIRHVAFRARVANYAKFRCNWCGSTQTIELNRESVNRNCPNCGAPR